MENERIEVEDTGKTLEELQQMMREVLVEKYSACGNKFRLSFTIAGVKCFTEPWTLDQLLDIYHGQGVGGEEDFNEMLDDAGAYPYSTGTGGWPEVQYEYIEGRVWRTVGQTYPN